MPAMNSISSSLILASCFAGLFALAEILYRVARLPAEVTRKIVHIGTGCLTLLFPIMLHSALEVGLLCGAFLMILLASMRFSLLPSINAVERDTLGSVIYPVIVFLVFLFYLHSAQQPRRIASPLYYFYTPILVMALCDPIAATAGSAWRRSHPNIPPGKTIAGSFAFFASAAILSGVLAGYFYKPGLPHKPSRLRASCSLFCPHWQNDSAVGDGTTLLFLPLLLQVSRFLKWGFKTSSDEHCYYPGRSFRSLCRGADKVVA